MRMRLQDKRTSSHADKPLTSSSQQAFSTGTNIAFALASAPFSVTDVVTPRVMELRPQENASTHERTYRSAFSHPDLGLATEDEIMERSLNAFRNCPEKRHCISAKAVVQASTRKSSVMNLTCQSMCRAPSHSHMAPQLTSGCCSCSCGFCTAIRRLSGPLTDSTTEGGVGLMTFKLTPALATFQPTSANPSATPVPSLPARRLHHPPASGKASVRWLPASTDARRREHAEKAFAQQKKTQGVP